MSDDLDLANLLGEGPPDGPDPGFRYDVFARVAERARRRAALSRAANQVAAFAAIGLIFPLAQIAGFSWESAQPVVLAAAALTVAAAAAVLTIQGPRGVLARSRAMLRAPLRRA
jgi:hypothetical protein